MKQSAPDRDPPFANPFPDRDPNRPTLLPTSTDYLGKVGFVPVMPSEPIDRWPRLLTGTLNFSSKKARWLTGLGYRDALARIKSEADRQASG